MAPSLTTFQLTLVYVRDVFLPQHSFNTCMDHLLGRMSEKSGCGVSFGSVRITDLDFADDAVILAETFDHSINTRMVFLRFELHGSNL